MSIQLPAIFVNFKTYEKATADRAEALARICQQVSHETGVQVVVAVQDADIYRVSRRVTIPVFAEHIDPVGYGSYTGQIIPEAVKLNGAQGTILNHSEDRVRLDVLETAIRRAHEVGLITLACANTPEAAASIAELGPDLIAVEPPELIGSGRSVSKAKPEVITDTLARVRKVANIPVLCGAGIVDADDVRRAIALGARGILVASAVTKAKDPEKSLRDLARGFSRIEHA
ncbi:triose-phosphate isomerase [Candidatus Woesearchaeota archaeon]|nr:triose-phosphate isomerase [Candidatus Woesearchaeota archaeon]